MLCLNITIPTQSHHNIILIEFEFIIFIIFVVSLLKYSSLDLISIQPISYLTTSTVLSRSCNELNNGRTEGRRSRGGYREG